MPYVFIFRVAVQKRHVDLQEISSEMREASCACPAMAMNIVVFFRFADSIVVRANGAKHIAESASRHHSAGGRGSEEAGSGSEEERKGREETKNCGGTGSGGTAATSCCCSSAECTRPPRPACATPTAEPAASAPTGQSTAG